MFSKFFHRKETVMTTFNEDGNTALLTTNERTPPSLEEVLSHVDLDVWEPIRHIRNQWEVASKIDGKMVVTPVYQLKVWFEKRKPLVKTVEDMLKALAKGSPAVKRIKRGRRKKNGVNHLLEISIFDLHLGMLAFKGTADHGWSVERAEQAFMDALEELLRLSEPYHIEKIVFVAGNDYLHAEWTGATTKGTYQEENILTEFTFERGKDLLINAIERMKEVAPVEVIFIRGNHANYAEFYLGHVIGAFFHRDRNVNVDFGPEPYKMIEYGVNLIAFEHGNNIKPPRMASLMAANWPDAWARTKYRVWHLGDQHRQGNASLVGMEEQGVAVEYLPSLVSANKWHRQMSFNNQQRGAVAFVWNRETGPVARLHSNLF